MAKSLIKKLETTGSPLSYVDGVTPKVGINAIPITSPFLTDNVYPFTTQLDPANPPEKYVDNLPG